LGNVNCISRGVTLGSVSSTDEQMPDFEPSDSGSRATVKAVRRIVSLGDLPSDATTNLGRMVKSVSFNDEVEFITIPKADNPQDLWWSKTERDQMRSTAHGTQSNMRRSSSADFTEMGAAGRATVHQALRIVRRLEARLQVPASERLTSTDPNQDLREVFNPRLVLNHVVKLAESARAGRFSFASSGRWSDVSSVVATCQGIEADMQKILG
jgi:hypothetical protein